MKTGSQIGVFVLPYEDIIRLYNEGLGILSIAVRVKVPAAKIKSYLREGNIIHEHCRNGKTEDQIRRAVNVSRERIRAVAKLKINRKFYPQDEVKGLPDYMI
tara:strand:- start:2317 stop:2622 length:306 start_codon:yes stop_codon:yes gene_type:complete